MSYAAKAKCIILINLKMTIFGLKYKGKNIFKKQGINNVVGLVNMLLKFFLSCEFVSFHNVIKLQLYITCHKLLFHTASDFAQRTVKITVHREFLKFSFPMTFF